MEDVNVSLEDHLAGTLKSIYPILPAALAGELAKYVTDPIPPLIPYAMLLKISQWSRTTDGERSLKKNSLNPHDFSMVALLAGSTTSPERKFGDYTPPKDPEEVEAERARERKAITALVNSVLSVGCMGLAAWWGTGGTGWKDEWRVLFAFFSAIIVAVAEAGLYLIWQSRKAKSSAHKVKRRSALHKKIDPAPKTHGEDNSPAAITNTPDESTTLRHRR
ncbi:hypothetical protein NLJ89_g322 [Agrocybe chaxingu]|uniref:Uncharacterized protein n=1 Tax=Agrocybe chaxingu TaxID=84603 RepID=A0A9W8TGL5_9AGAR|nr:hypothetical protein NLJ89_g322 [Agrocybe chaxingu]